MLLPARANKPHLKLTQPPAAAAAAVMFPGAAATFPGAAAVMFPGFRQHAAPALRTCAMACA